MKKKNFLIGGFIRDRLLGMKNIEKDWLLLKTSIKNMIKNNFKPVGKDFPVFLHPITKEEHALARKEKKIKKGYTGFKCYFSPDINLKTDIYRRDLTANIIALDKKGKIYDYIKSKLDLRNKILKSVSEAFSEDPLRIIRLSRFWQKYHKNGFLISAHTYFLVKKIIQNNEIKHISNERIIKEINSTLKYKNIQTFFYFLYLCKATKIIFIDLNLLIHFSCENKENFYLNLWLKTYNIIEKLKQKSNNKQINFLTLFFFLRYNIFFKKYYKKKNYYNIKNFINYYKNKFILSKKYVKYIETLNITQIIFKNINTKKNTIQIKNIQNTKDKIKIINSLLITEINNEINTHVNAFYKKYIILEILDNKKNKNVKLFYYH